MYCSHAVINHPATSLIPVIFFPGADFEIEAGDYSILPEQENVTLSLTLLDDSVAEVSETIYLLVENQLKKITITDNESEYSSLSQSQTRVKMNSMTLCMACRLKTLATMQSTY